jgi:hypothetical protein
VITIPKTAGALHRHNVNAAPMCLNLRNGAILGIVYINRKLKLTQNVFEPEEF